MTTFTPPSQFVEVHLTRAQAEHLYLCLLTLEMRGYTVNRVDARIRFALEQGAGDKRYDWNEMRNEAKRKLARVARASQHGKSVRGLEDVIRRNVRAMGDEG